VRKAASCSPAVIPAVTAVHDCAAYAKKYVKYSLLLFMALLFLTIVTYIGSFAAALAHEFQLDPANQLPKISSKDA
jgi:hypothetical protein